MKAKEVKQEKINGFDKWEIEGCLDTLIRAEEIKRDPEKMKAVMKIADVKISSIRSIEDLKKIHEEKFGAKPKMIEKEEAEEEEDE